MKERVKNILNYKKPTGWVILIAMIVCAIAVFGFMTNKKEKAGAETPVSQKQEIEDAEPIQYYYGNAIEAEIVDVDKTKDDVSKLTEYPLVALIMMGMGMWRSQ